MWPHVGIDLEETIQTSDEDPFPRLDYGREARYIESESASIIRVSINAEIL